MVGKPASPSMHTADGRSQRLLPLQVVLAHALTACVNASLHANTPLGRPGTDAGLHEPGPVLGAEEARRGPG